MSTSSSMPPGGNGATPQTASFSSSLQSNPAIQPQYVVNRIEVSPWYFRVSLRDAHLSRNDGYQILDGRTFQPVTHPPPVMVAKSAPTTGTITEQEQEIVGAESTLAAAGDQQYQVTQGLHETGAASNDSDEDGKHDSSSNEASSSSSSGDGRSVGS